MITTLSTDFADLVAEFVSHEQDLIAAGKLNGTNISFLSFKNNVLLKYSELDIMFPSAKNYLAGEYEIVSLAMRAAYTDNVYISGTTQFKLLIIPVRHWENTSVVEYEVSPSAELINLTVPAGYDATIGYYSSSDCTVSTEQLITGPFIVDAGDAWSFKIPNGNTEPAIFISCAISPIIS
jgi:hypothetical protein